MVYDINDRIPDIVLGIETDHKKFNSAKIERTNNLIPLRELILK
jgi:hypothetical protein